MTLLDVRNLSTSFHTDRGEIRAVDGISFEIDANEKHALVGESGAGKSVSGLSILQLIERPGHIKPDSRVYWKGEDLGTKSNAELDRIRGNEIAWVPQRPLSALNPTATIGKQLKETMRTHEFGSEDQIHDRAVALLERVGIPDVEVSLTSYPHEFSGGMRQRVLIAMAASCNPDLLIADEPTTALDVITQAQVIEVLNEMIDTFDMSLLLITHDLGVVKEICDHVMVMYAGQVVERTRTDVVFDEPLHPYTRALIDCSPTVATSTELQSIPGSVPDGATFPDGCRFHPRCDEVMERCSRVEPRLRTERGTQDVSCHLYE
mgnify:CR=1 FL=1